MLLLALFRADTSDCIMMIKAIPDPSHNQLINVGLHTISYIYIKSTDDNKINTELHSATSIYMFLFNRMRAFFTLYTSALRRHS